MGDIYSYLREDWARSRSTLARQIDIFASEKMGLNLAPRLKQRIIARLTAAITEYDCLLQDDDTQD